MDRARSFRRGQYKIDLNLRVGSRLPSYCTSLGKVLLAFLPDEEQHELVVGMALAKRGPHTITARKALRDELANVIEQGFAVSDEELAAGLVSIAVPVRGATGDVIAALGISAHTSMIELRGSGGPAAGALAGHGRATLCSTGLSSRGRRGDALNTADREFALRRRRDTPSATGRRWACRRAARFAGAAGTCRAGLTRPGPARPGPARPGPARRGEPASALMRLWGRLRRGR